MSVGKLYQLYFPREIFFSSIICSAVFREFLETSSAIEINKNFELLYKFNV